MILYNTVIPCNRNHDKALQPPMWISETRPVANFPPGTHPAFAANAFFFKARCSIVVDAVPQHAPANASTQICFI